MSRPDYEGEFIKQLRKNAAAIPAQLAAGDKNLAKKIATFAERHGYSVGRIVKKIKEDLVFAAHFAVDPAKQKIHENIAAKHIKKLKNVQNFNQLSHGALSVLQGAVMSRVELLARGGTSRAKTIDFMWITCGKRVYASHKYTRGEGGAQDNQYADMQQFIREARDSTLKDTIFIAIADGEYYNKSRIDNLKSLANERNVFAIPIEELPALLKKMCASEFVDGKIIV